MTVAATAALRARPTMSAVPRDWSSGLSTNAMTRCAPASSICWLRMGPGGFAVGVPVGSMRFGAHAEVACCLGGESVGAFRCTVHDGDLCGVKVGEFTLECCLDGVVGVGGEVA